MRIVFSAIFFLLFAQCSYGSGIGELEKDIRHFQYLTVSLAEADVPTGENTRLVSMVLTVVVGPFGGHRLYLGTDAKVPVFYALTLGGGLGVLPLIDLLCITFTKDLSKYIDNDRIFMFLGK